MRSFLLTILGGILGTTLGLLVWLILAIAISAIIAYFYPGGISPVMGFLPSDESFLTGCILLFLLPIVALYGALLGVKRAEYIEAKWVLQSLPHGVITTFREDGTRFKETTYHRGLPHGLHRDYWPNGMVAYEGQFVNEKQDGQWRQYNQDGSLRQVYRFNSGKLIQD
jgi:hypothetical protein